jgi:hypothetical protein
MADILSSLSVKTEAPGDLAVKIVDGTIASQQLSVNADGSINAAVSGTVTVQATDLDIRDLSAAQDSVTVLATDLDIRDLTSTTDSVAADLLVGGAAVAATNPVPVTITKNNIGTEIADANVASIAKFAVSNHDYTVPVGKTFRLTQVEASASGQMRVDIQVETAPGVFATKFTQYNSAANLNLSLKLESPIEIAAGLKVRVARTNREGLMDVHSTICGQEV